MCHARMFGNVSGSMQSSSVKGRGSDAHVVRKAAKFMASSLAIERAAPAIVPSAFGGLSSALLLPLDGWMTDWLGGMSLNQCW